MASPTVVWRWISLLCSVLGDMNDGIIFSSQCQSKGRKEKNKILGLKYEVFVPHLRKKQ